MHFFCSLVSGTNIRRGPHTTYYPSGLREASARRACGRRAALLFVQSLYNYIGSCIPSFLPRAHTLTKPRVIAFGRKEIALAVHRGGEVDEAQAAQEGGQESDADGALWAEGHAVSQAVEEAVRRPVELAGREGQQAGGRGPAELIGAFCLGCCRQHNKR